MPGRSTYIPSPLGGGLGRGFGGIPSYNPYPTLSLRRERVFWRPHFFALLFFTICPIMRGNIHIPLIRMAKSHFSQLTVAASIQDHQSVRVEVVGAVPALPQHPHRGVTMVHGENPAPRQVAQDLSQALATGAVGRYGCPLRVVLGAVPALPQHPHRGVTMVHGENPAPRQVAQDLSQALATGAADQHGCRRRVVAGGRQLPKYRQPVGIGVTRPASIHKATVRYTAKTGILKAPEGVVPETCRRPVLRASPRGERK